MIIIYTIPLYAMRAVWHIYAAFLIYFNALSFLLFFLDRERRLLWPVCFGSVITPTLCLSLHPPPSPSPLPLSLSVCASACVCVIFLILIQFCVYLGRPTFYRIIKNNSPKWVIPEYHLAMMVYSVFWVFYGMPFISPRSILVLTGYGIDLSMHLAFLIIILLYANDNKKKGMYLVLTYFYYFHVGWIISIVVIHIHKCMDYRCT